MISSNTATFSSSGRLDDLCASTTDLWPPSKPIRQITGEYHHANAILADSRPTHLWQNAVTSTSSCDSDESTTSHSIRKTSAEYPANAIFSNTRVVASARNVPPTRSSDVHFWNTIMVQNTNADSYQKHQLTSPVISKPCTHSSNIFLGVPSRQKTSLLDEDDRCTRMKVPRFLIIDSVMENDMSDLEDDLTGIMDHDRSRWSHSSSSNLDRTSSSEFSMPSKPKRRASFLKIAHHKIESHVR